MASRWPGDIVLGVKCIPECVPKALRDNPMLCKTQLSKCGLSIDIISHVLTTVSYNMYMVGALCTLWVWDKGLESWVAVLEWILEVELCRESLEWYRKCK